LLGLQRLHHNRHTNLDRRGAEFGGALTSSRGGGSPRPEHEMVIRHLTRRTATR
jgi:hypothetical protein